MLDEEGTNSNKKLLIFRKDGIDDVFGEINDINTLIKMYDPDGITESTNFEFAVPTVVEEVMNIFMHLPANWNEGS